MKYLYMFSSLIFAALLISGCSHINELAKYDLHGQGMLFKTHTSADAAKIQIVNSSSDQNKNQQNSLLSTIASIGSDLLSSDKEQKIVDAVKTDSMASYVSDGLKNALITYLNIMPTETINDNPQFIVETTLESCQLRYNSDGVWIRVSAVSKIIDRATANIIWDDSETQTIPVHNNNDYETNKSNDQTLKKVMGALQLSSLSEKEIQDIVDQAAKEAGQRMGNTLRKDIVKSRQKN